MPKLCFQAATNLFDLGVSKSKIPHSVIGKYMNTLLSNQEVPIFFTAFGRPVLVTFSLLESKWKTEKKRKKTKCQTSKLKCSNLRAQSITKTYRNSQYTQFIIDMIFSVREQIMCILCCKERWLCKDALYSEYSKEHTIRVKGLQYCGTWHFIGTLKSKENNR